MGSYDLERLAEPSLAVGYRIAEPFPHVVLEDFVRVPEQEIADAFPGPEWEHWANRTSRFQPGKSSCRDIEAMPPTLRAMVHELGEPPFLRALCALTGIPHLLPDPYLQGGGLQWTGPGGELSRHTDFHFHRTLPLFRRANVLIFLSSGWKEGDGGELCLFNLGDDRAVVTIPPRFGTCAIFTTDHRSVHAVRPISASARPRQSIACFYYTVESAEIFSGDRRARWYVDDERDHTPMERARLLAMKTSMSASKTLVRVAYRIDPQRPDLV